jgi:hypothetical protein
MRHFGWFLCILLGHVGFAANAQTNLLQYADMVALCATQANCLLCDSAVALASQEADSPDKHLIIGSAHFQIFQILQTRAFNSAYDSLGKKLFSPARAYIYIGDEETERIKRRAKQAEAHLVKAKKFKEAIFMLKEIRYDMAFMPREGF